MPCSDGLAYDRMMDEKELKEQKALVLLYKESTDKLTDILCELCSTMPLENLTQNARGWYTRHLQQDKIRIMQQLESKSEHMTGKAWREIEAILDKIP